MTDRFIVECYDSKGDKCLPTVEVDNSMQGLFVLGQRLALDYVHATCYLLRDAEVIEQWELEIK